MCYRNLEIGQAQARVPVPQGPFIAGEGACGPPPMAKNGDRMGMNYGWGFVFNAGVMGISGDQRRKSFRNGDQGRGRGYPGNRHDRGIGRNAVNPKVALKGVSSIEFGDVAVLRLYGEGRGSTAGALGYPWRAAEPILRLARELRRARMLCARLRMAGRRARCGTGHSRSKSLLGCDAECDWA
jgi:hypothetical protein